MSGKGFTGSDHFKANFTRVYFVSKLQQPPLMDPANKLPEIDTPSISGDLFPGPIMAIIWELTATFFKQQRQKNLSIDEPLRYCLSTTVGTSGREDFQPKQISTIQCHTGSSSTTTGTKSPQVAVIPPLVDLTKVTSDSDNGKKDDKSKGSSGVSVLIRIMFLEPVHT